METIRYFQSYDHYFWIRNLLLDTSEEPSYVYETANGSTIAYSDYVIEVLRYLSLESIPPLGSLLLAIAATNSNADALLNDIKSQAKSVEVNSAYPNANLNGIDAAFEFLEILSSLPDSFKRGKNRLLLFKVIFKDCHNRIATEKAQKIIDEYTNDEFNFNTINKTIAFNKANFVKDFRTIGLINLRFVSAEQIIKAIEDLPDLQEISDALEDEILNPETVNHEPKDFIEELIDNDKTFHVGSLIKRIWSGLKIPLHQSLPSNQPLGGISDITNKGDFDRLLLSEFANDDLVFMSRIANNEALYIEREVPPESDTFIRHLLIDVSIKSWGNPKLISFATAIAIANHPKSNSNCEIFTLGNESNLVSCDAVEDVIDSLQYLSSGLDCSQGFLDYLNKIQELKTERETYLILTEENLRSAALQKSIHENLEALHFIITTNAAGEIGFYKIAHKSKKQIQKITLPLEELWIKNRTNSSKNKSSGIDHKAINYPLLFAVPDNNITRNFIGDYIYFLTKNKNVYKAYYPREGNKQFRYGDIKGAQLVQTNISFKTEGEFVVNENIKGELELYGFYKDTGFLFCLNLETKKFIKHINKVTLIHQDFKMIASEHQAYLIHEKLENSLLISNDGDELSTSLQKEDPKPLEVFRKDSAVLRNMYNYNSNKLKNFNTIFINHEGNICLNKHKLNFHIYQNYEYINFISEGALSKTSVAKREKNKFIFNDGSEVQIDKNGMLTFVSSNPEIPVFYLPTTIQLRLGIATDDKFAGNNHFLPHDSDLTVISVREFQQSYVEPFINTILNYASYS